MIWTAIVGGGLVIVKWHGWSDELLYNLGLVHLLCGYIVLVSGILGLIQEGFSKDVRGYVFSPRGPYHYSPGFGSLWKPQQE